MLTTRDAEYARLNREAACLLKSADYFGAERRWSLALRLLLPCLNVVITTLEEVPSRSNTTDQDVYCLYVEPADHVDQDNALSVFSCGILYCLLPSTWTTLDYRKAAAATLFNMALASHLHGLQDANNSAFLEKALKTYQLARGLLCSEVQDIRSEPQDVKLLALAIANNEGNIHSSRYEMGAAKECWLTILMLLPHTSPTTQTLHFFASAAAYPNEDSLCTLHAPVA